MMKMYIETLRQTNTLVQFGAIDCPRAVSVVLLEESPPLLHEAPQRREAKHVNAPRPCPVKHV